VTVDRAEFGVTNADLPVELRESGGHGGAEAHLVHEFVRSIIEARPSSVSATVAADWTAAGLCAHESALLGGQPVLIPQFDGSRSELGSMA
jgi:hypothetical protein